MAQKKMPTASPALRRRIRKWYDGGMTLRELQTKTGYSRGALANFLHEDGGHVRPRGIRKTPRR